MKFEVLYKDWTRLSSDDMSWKDMPKDNVVVVWIIFPSKSKMQVSGWDHYALKRLKNGIGVYIWKDKDAVDINGDPMYDAYAGHFSYREFFDDNTGNKIEYKKNELLPTIPKEMIKHGTWVTDELAKQMGI